MTDLIDRAALREKLVQLDIENRLDELFDTLDAAPTIECAACEYGRIGTFDQSIVHCALNHGESRGRTWFCGDFKRRQP